MRITMTIPWRTVPKARPRVTKRGTYMPPRYREWKKDVAEYINLQHPKTQLSRPLKIVAHFGSESTYVELLEYDTDFTRAKYVTGDVDNLLGGLMDALQDSGLIADDRQVVHCIAVVERRDT